MTGALGSAGISAGQAGTAATVSSIRPLAPPVAHRSTKLRIAVSDPSEGLVGIEVQFGDGTTQAILEQPCSVAPIQPPVALVFSAAHKYRTPGQYQVTAVPLTSHSCPVAGPELRREEPRVQPVEVFPAMVRVPAVKGLSYQQADCKLLAAGLRWRHGRGGKIRAWRSDCPGPFPPLPPPPYGSVGGQLPPRGRTVPAGTPVTLLRERCKTPPGTVCV